ncbi:MAG: diguanylate cyclase, partial [Planctomycetes bacterium]|nr:diguanylate cyclase [Planctomycetota bacterium]
VDITTPGVVCCMGKSLQANLNHVIWQMEQVEAGDLTQRVDFMGDFSAAFNSMVFQLDSALTALRNKERELTAITEELRQEVEKREAALRALQQSEENFRYLAEHDPLTGILNRRSFLTQAELQLARNTIMDHPSSIAIMDIDHFKQFNDTHGHPAGDRALKHVAEVSGSILRPNDIMGRMGGEEFLFFFSKTNIDQARRVAERIRERIADSPVPVDHGQAIITAPSGVVSFTAQRDGQSAGGGVLEQAMAVADEALYRAKAAGRNKVRTGAFIS